MFEFSGLLIPSFYVIRLDALAHLRLVQGGQDEFRRGDPGGIRLPAQLLS